MVMPRSRSRSFESITRSCTCSCAAKVPDCCSSLSTRVVFPWSTCAMMAKLRMRRGMILILLQKRPGIVRSFHLDAGLLDDAAPFVGFPAYESGESVRRAADRFDGLPGQLLAQFGQRQRALKFRVQPRDNRSRRSGGRVEPEPQSGAESGDALLGEGRHPG